MVSDIQPITADLVRELRLKGLGREAERLVEAHQRSILDNKAKQLRELRNISQKKYVYFKKTHGLCVNCAKPKR